MANYYGNARTNYFKVKDLVALKAALAEVYDIEIDTNTHDPELVCIVVTAGDSGGWPSWVYPENQDEEQYEIDIVAVVGEHLADGEVAIFMEAGSEKLRYLVGFAEAINSKGERESISITDIYGIARKMTDRPEDITKAEY